MDEPLKPYNKCSRYNIIQNCGGHNHIYNPTNTEVQLSSIYTMERLAILFHFKQNFLSDNQAADVHQSWWKNEEEEESS